MNLKTWLQLGITITFVILAAGVAVVWRSEVRERAQLQQELKSAQDALTAANARESARNAAVKKQVAQLQKSAATIKTPQEVIAALPGVLPLPQPISLDANLPGAAGPAKAANLPLVDLKPLYDSAVACKECQTELAAAQANLKDEQAKTQAASRERDDALRVAKGGSAFRRVARAAKWFLIGAAAGAAAAKLAH
jgi:hypothetical protein